MRSGPLTGTWRAWRSELVPVARWVQRLIAAGFRLFLALLVTSAVRAQAPHLELSRAPEGSRVQLRLSGATSQMYVVEISTNLTLWQTLTQVQTTNGTATLVHDISLSHHSFLRARAAEQTGGAITPQVSSASSAKALISAAGGELKLVTPDFRPITLSIPAGCLINPMEVRMTLVTNLVGLPFLQGTFGTVQIEPESLVLLGSAQLSIEYPPGLDSRMVVSFAAKNDGAGFGLTVDRALSNRVVIPVWDFALYGSAVATLAEVEPFVRESAKKPSLSALDVEPTPVDFCRAFHPDEFNVNVTQFPASARECFMFMVDRAIKVQEELRSFVICDVMDPLAAVLAWNRQRQLFGLPDNSFTIISNAVGRICPIYQSKIDPLWEEAKANCALSVVLLQFMLGFEQQVQVLGLTNLASCNYTLFGNLDKLCKAAENCLQFVKGCCDLGKTGPAKYLEVLQIVKQFESLGDTSCFPEKMDDPLVQEVLDVCLTNSWYGTLQVKRHGNGSTNITEGGTDFFYSFDLNAGFSGQIFSADEFKNAEGRAVQMRIIGTGTSREESIFTQSRQTPCLNGGTSSYFSSNDRVTTGSIALTGNENFPKVFLLEIQIARDNKTYSVSGAPPSSIGTQQDQSFNSTTHCEGDTKSTSDSTEFDANVGFAGISVENRTMGSDTNLLEGTHSFVEDWGSGRPVINMTTEMTWSLKRARQR